MKSLSLFLFVLVLVTAPVCAFAGGLPVDNLAYGSAWMWEASQYNNDTRAVPDAPERYVIVFEAGGGFSGQADCNRIRGQYTADGQQISFGPIISTKAMCPENSLDQTFLKDLGNAAIFFLKDNTLYLDLKFHAGTMAFVRAPGSSETLCRDPRPEACTMEYDPVCGIKADQGRQTYGNGCQACADPEVISFTKGDCP